MKTTEQIALEVANTITAPYISDEALTRFAEKLLAAWLEQQSQEPVAYMAPSGTCVTAEDVSYTPNWTDYYTIPLYAAPPAKVEQQSQEPAMVRFDRLMEDCKETPIERLRFFCSLAMNSRDWLDVEPFFDALSAQQSQEPVAWAAWDMQEERYRIATDRKALPAGDPLFLAPPPAKVDQQSQEPVAWMSEDKEDYSYGKSNYFCVPLFLAPQPATPEGYVLVPIGQAKDGERYQKLIHLTEQGCYQLTYFDTDRGCWEKVSIAQAQGEQE